jgi:asparagine synthase (glutamine-hydrolysing)
MCGIAGGIWNDPKLVLDRTTLERMVDVLTHRGPDDAGIYFDHSTSCPSSEIPTGVALGARRLAIIDVESGQQPIGNEDGTVWVVHNGEIYNHRELRQRLESSGHVFRTSCDTETLVHLYEEEGTDFVQHLSGMFALAIWDGVRKQLVLARDRLGQKPLIYRHEPGRLLFASEIKSLLQIPGLRRKLRPEAIDQFLTYQYVPHPGTIFTEFKKLPPAHLAIYSQDRLTIKRYWDPDWNHEVTNDNVLGTLRKALTQSVESRLQSDVPVSAFLSGGVDSSIIVALMRELSYRKVQTFSIGFNIPEYDETAYAVRVSDHLDTEHHVLQVPDNVSDIAERLARHFDEPFGDSSAIPTWYLAEQTGRSAKVALSGDGGDELFSGYPRYQAVQLGATIDHLPKPFRAMAGARFWQSLPRSNRRGWLRRFGRFTDSLLLKPDLRYLEWISIFNQRAKHDLYTEDFFAKLGNSDPADFLTRAWQSIAGRDAVTTAAMTDLQTYLPCDLMTKVDIVTMAHSLECRQPFLDHGVVEIAISLPNHLKYRRGHGKQILREIFGDLLPAEVFTRPKMGFGVPLDHWFRNELKSVAHDILLDKTCIEGGIFRVGGLKQLLSEHCENRCDHSDRLWSLLMLELWKREWNSG